jgi:hypothetical protein
MLVDRRREDTIAFIIDNDDCGGQLDQQSPGFSLV